MAVLLSADDDLVEWLTEDCVARGAVVPYPGTGFPYPSAVDVNS